MKQCYYNNHNSAGMLVKDRDKGIRKITYNNIGLVDSILFESGAKVVYTYAMTGEKLRVRHYAAPQSVVSPRAGIGGALIPTRPGVPTISYDDEEYYGADLVKYCHVAGTDQQLPTYKYFFGNGYVAFNSIAAQPTYYYYTKDHLGNVRSVVKANTDGTAEEVQHTAYYPFGGIIPQLSDSLSLQNRLYNGKELDRSNNLWWYDYGARQYMPDAPRFNRGDRYAEKYYAVNMYGYCANNPTNAIDHKGDSIIKIIINDNTNTIHGRTSLYIDHTVWGDIKSILDYCVNTNTKIVLNSSFRTNKKQGKLNSKNATTPAKAGNSPHNAGIGIDFNLFNGNKVDNGNKNVTNETPFIKFIKTLGWRWGGNFKNPDRIHIDKRESNDTFKELRDYNQMQMNGNQEDEPTDKYVNRIEELDYE